MAAKPSWWPSRAAPTPSRSSTCSARCASPLGSDALAWPTCITASAPRPTRRPTASRRLCRAAGRGLPRRAGHGRARAPPWDGLEAEAGGRATPRSRARPAAVGAARIATGHTADDQAETVLMRLLAGRGPARARRHRPGARALHPPADRDAGGPRSRRTCAARGLAWVEDATNRDPRFLRNRIRHDLLPFLAELTGGLGGRGPRPLGGGRARGGGRPRGAGRARELARLATRDAAGLVPRRRRRCRRCRSSSPRRCCARPRPRSARRARSAAPPSARSAGCSGAPPRRARAARAGWPSSGAAAGSASGRPRCPRSPTRAWPVPGALDAAGDRRSGSTPALVAARRLRGRRATPRASPSTRTGCPRALAVRARRRGDASRPSARRALRRLKSFLIDAGVPRWQRARMPLRRGGRRDHVGRGPPPRRARAGHRRDHARILEVTLDPPRRWRRPGRRR